MITPKHGGFHLVNPQCAVLFILPPGCIWGLFPAPGDAVSSKGVTPRWCKVRETLELRLFASLGREKNAAFVQNHDMEWHEISNHGRSPVLSWIIITWYYTVCKPLPKSDARTTKKVCYKGREDFLSLTNWHRFDGEELDEIRFIRVLDPWSFLGFVNWAV